MLFTERLYKETKDSHREVDKHPFVEMIRTNKLAAEMYINFNKICINEIQKVLILNDNDLYDKLYKDIIIPEIYINPALQELLNHCKKYPLESAYQFYLGLLFGGNMLKRMISEDHHEFLTHENSRILIKNFKQYLCDNVNETDQQEFINNVNKSYVLIKNLFDTFFKKISKN